MVKKNYFKVVSIFAVLALAAASAWYFFFYETDEGLIRERFAAVSKIVRKNKSEGAIGLAYFSQALPNSFTPFVSVEIDRLPWLSGTISIENATANALRARQMFKSMSLDFYNIEIAVQPEKKFAAVFFTCDFAAVTKSGERISEVLELEANLSKEDGRWRFSSCRIRELVKK